MRIGIISDTHDQLQNLSYCLNYLRNDGIETVIHCGDLGRDYLITLFEGLRLIIVFGNCDKVTNVIQRRVEQLGMDSFAGQTFDGYLDGKQILVTHGYYQNDLMQAALSGQYQYIISGHTHWRKDEQIGETRMINPGALGGTKHQTRSFMVLDLAKDELSIVEVQDYL